MKQSMCVCRGDFVFFGDFVRWRFCAWEILCVGDFVLVDFVRLRFVCWWFCVLEILFVHGLAVCVGVYFNDFVCLGCECMWIRTVSRCVCMCTCRCLFVCVQVCGCVCKCVGMFHTNFTFCFKFLDGESFIFMNT